jgi:hypothetical protein
MRGARYAKNFRFSGSLASLLIRIEFCAPQRAFRAALSCPAWPFLGSYVGWFAQGKCGILYLIDTMSYAMTKSTAVLLWTAIRFCSSRVKR